MSTYKLIQNYVELKRLDQLEKIGKK